MGPEFVSVKVSKASLCSHSIAVADHTTQLDQFLSWFHSRGRPNITAAVSAAAPENTGKTVAKDHELAKQRRMAHHEMITCAWTDAPMMKVQLSKMSSATT